MKITPEGWAVLENDSHISRWVEQHGRLNIQEDQLRPWLFNVKKGDWAIDIGACIGDTAATLIDAVGAAGMVWAFEPNPEAYKCLYQNARLLGGIMTFNCAIGDKEGVAKMIVNENAGASSISSGGDIEVSVVRLDDNLFTTLSNRISFIKIDVEGYEPAVLRGGVKTIKRHKPDMFIEVNDGALRAAGSSKDELLRELDDLGYGYKIVSARCDWKSPQFDIFCQYGAEAVLK